MINFTIIMIFTAEELIGAPVCEFQYKFIYKILDIQEVKRIMICNGKILVYHLCLKVDNAEQSDS